MTVSIILLNHDAADLTRACLASLVATEAADHEILVVDNAGTQPLPVFQSPARLLRPGANLGFAGGNNFAAARARGDRLLFLNNDTEVSPGWLTPLVEAMRDPDVGVAGSKLVFFDRPSIIQSAGVTITFDGRGFDVGMFEPDGPRFDRPQSAGAVCGASMIVRRDEFLALGGFDAAYFLYFEDVDLCWRYRLLGKDVRYVPQSVVRHRYGATVGSERASPQRLFLGTRNSLLNLLKNYEIASLPWPLTCSLARQVAMAASSLVRLDLARAAAIPRAWTSAAGLLRDTFHKRTAVQQNRRVRDRELSRHGFVASLPGAVREALRLRRHCG